MIDPDDSAPPILAHKHYRSPSAFTPESLLREARRQKGAPAANQMGRIEGDFEKGEADGSAAALAIIVRAARRLL